LDTHETNGKDGRGQGGRLRVKSARLADLKPAPYNPRTISEGALSGLGASIDRFGLVQPIIVNERTGRVVGGHQRLKVLESRGETETDVILVDLPEDEEKALNVALNSGAISGQWTPAALPLLADIALELPELSADLLLPVLAGDLEKLLGSFDVGDGQWPETPARDASDVRQITFTVSHTQADVVGRAIAGARDRQPSEMGGNSNGDALTVLAEAFLGV